MIQTTGSSSLLSGQELGALTIMLPPLSLKDPMIRGHFSSVKYSQIGLKQESVSILYILTFNFVQLLVNNRQ